MAFSKMYWITDNSRFKIKVTTSIRNGASRIPHIKVTTSIRNGYNSANNNANSQSS